MNGDGDPLDWLAGPSREGVRVAASMQQDPLDWLSNPPKREEEPAELGFGDAIDEVGAEQIPFAGMLVDAKEMVDLYTDAKALERGDATPEQQERIRAFLTHEGRHKTIGYQAGKILTNLPAYAIEFMAGGAVAERLFAKLGTKLAGTALKEGLVKAAAEIGEGAVARAVRSAGGKAAKVAATAAVQTAAMPGRIVSSTVERALAGHLGVTDRDELGRANILLEGSIPSLLDELPAGIVDTYIENVSEHSGGAIEAIPGAKLLQLNFLTAWSKATGNPVAKALDRIAKGTGWHGMLAEMGEERVGDVLRAVVLGDPWANVIPSKEQAAAEAIGFAVPGVIGAAARAAGSRFGQIEDQKTATNSPADAGNLAGSSVPRGTLDDQGEGGGESPGRDVGDVPDVSSSAAGEERASPPPEPASLEDDALAELGDLPEAEQAPRAPAADASPFARTLAKRLVAENVRTGNLDEGQAGVAEVVEPNTDDERFDAARSRERGLELVYVDAGRRLRLPAAFEDNVVVLDARAPSAARKNALLMHEWAHALRRNGPHAAEGWERLESLIRAKLPKLYDESREHYRELAQSARGVTLGEDLAREETVSNAIENIAGYLHFAYTNQEAAVRLATESPALFARAFRALVQAAASVLGVKTQRIRDLEALADSLEGSFLDTKPGRTARGLHPKLVTRVALAARELFDRLGVEGERPAGARSASPAEEKQEQAPAAAADGATIESDDDGQVRGDRDSGAEGQEPGAPHEAVHDRPAPAVPRGARKRRQKAGAEADAGRGEAGPVADAPARADAPAERGPERGDGDGGAADGGEHPGTGEQSADDLKALFDRALSEAFEEPKPPSPAPEVADNGDEIVEVGGVRWRVKKAKIEPTRAGVVVHPVDKDGKPNGPSSIPANEPPAGALDDAAERAKHWRSEGNRRLPLLVSQWEDAVRAKRGETVIGSIEHSIGAVLAFDVPETLPEHAHLVNVATRAGIDVERAIRLAEQQAGKERTRAPASPAKTPLTDDFFNTAAAYEAWVLTLPPGPKREWARQSFDLARGARKDIPAQKDLTPDELEEMQASVEALYEHLGRKQKAATKKAAPTRKPGGPRPTTKQPPPAAPPRTAFDQAVSDIEGLFAIDAWHGSSSVFEKFLTAYIGTGEGAQAYGWGLYFADLRAIAEHYREKLSRGDAPPEEILARYFEPGRIVPGYAGFDRVVRFEPSDGLFGWRVHVIRVVPSSPGGKIVNGEAVPTAPFEWITEPGARERMHYTAPKWADIEKVLGPQRLGRTYQVELAPADDEYLLWDKPIAEQSEKVRAALAQLPRFTHPQDKGSDAYNSISARLYREAKERGDPTYQGMGDEHTSKALHKLGVRGIKYLDGGSRADGSGSFNYVIFDEDDVSIRSVFAIEPAVAAKAFPETKVVDEKGLPRVVYHGTRAYSDFTEFNTDPWRGDFGAHFTDEPIVANTFAEPFVGPGDNGRILPVYLNIKNPLRLVDNGIKGRWNTEPIGRQLLKAGVLTEEEFDRYKRWQEPHYITYALKRAGYDGVVYLNRREVPSATRAKLSHRLSHHKMVAVKTLDSLRTARLSDELFRERFPRATDAWIALEPQQIKSALGNRGTFDAGERDIRFAVEPPAFDEEKYARAKGPFQQIAGELGKGAHNPFTLMQAIVLHFKNVRGWNAERIRGMQPYVIRFATEHMAVKPPLPVEPKTKAEREGMSTPAPVENYRIRAEDEIGAGGAKTKADQNLAAVRIVKALEAERRGATLEEQRALVKYVGWGSSELANGMFPRGEPKAEWASRAAELKSLLTSSEWNDAKRSTINAHYTSPGIVSGMWKALSDMGFAGGRVLEPGMGVGHFLGLVPESLVSKVQYTGVELDATTGAVAKALYPRSDIHVEDFAKFKAPREFYDVAIGNPPFADITVLADPEYAAQKLALHDFFFVKTLDRVRAGGLVVFVTSRYTMDKEDSTARKLMQERAELVGAIRLPDNAFKANAGTEVVTDVLFLRKLAPGVKPLGTQWSELTKSGAADFRINEYFAANPRMVLGRHSSEGSMYGANQYTVKATQIGGSTLEEQFLNAIANLPRNVYVSRSRADGASDTRAQKPVDLGLAPTNIKEGAYHLDEKGNLAIREQGRSVLVPMRAKGVHGMTKGDAAIVRDFVPLRDAVRRVLHVQLTEGNLEEAQRAMTKLYDAFVKKHGALNTVVVRERTHPRTKEVTEYTTYPVFEAFEDDPDSYLVASIEEYDAEKKTASKAAIFTERTIRPEVSPEIKSPSDALNVVLARTGKVDLPEIAALADVGIDTAREALEGVIFLDPATDTWQTDDAYLSGDVRAKLKVALAAAEKNPDFRGNVTALEKVQPKDLTASQIKVRLGAPWLEPKDIEAFLAEEMGYVKPRVEHIEEIGAWTVDTTSTTDGGVLSTSDYGTQKKPAASLVAAALNSSRVVVYTYVDRKPVVDAEATAAAQDKLEKIQERFGRWIFESTERGARNARVYNDTFNGVVVRKFSGAHLTLPGMSGVKLRDHQKAVVWRIIQTGNTYMAHDVGAGKTFAMIAAGMEMKRLGMVSKPMYVVPAHMLNQFAREFLQAYPAARIMVADEKQFAKENRRRFVARVSTGNWDGIVIPYYPSGSTSPFEKIPVSGAFMKRWTEQFLEAYEKLLDSGDIDDDRTRKQIEKKMEAMRQRVERRTDEERKDPGPSFEELGVDFLFVDEAQYFRKLDFPTNQGRVKGISPDGSSRAFDLYIKSRYLEEKNPGRAMVLASGTPITNTMGELFTLQRMLQERTMGELGLDNFDAWASMFGTVATGLEQDPTGRFKPVTRFARFINLPELSQLVRQVMDVVMVKDLHYIKRPKVIGGEMQIVVAKRSPKQQEAQQMLGAALAAAKPRERGTVMLQVITDGRLQAVDARFRINAAPEFEPARTSDPDNKLNTLIASVFQIYQETTGAKLETEIAGKKVPITASLTQMVFADLGTPENAVNRGFSAYAWMRSELLRMGVKPDEIAFMQDYKKAEAKLALFREMNTGQKRILIGSTATMGTGVNAQRLLKALHHLDCPWFPSDLTQRNGRALRQGNLNEEIHLKAYSTEGTYDSQMWSLNAIKQGFIEQFMLGDPDLREMDDVGSEADSYATAKAITSGNPLLMEKVGLETEIAKLYRQRYSHDDEQRRLRDTVTYDSIHAAAATSRAAAIEESIKSRVTDKADEFRMTLFGEEIEGAKGGKDVVEGMLMKWAAENAREHGKKENPGTANGYVISLVGEGEGLMGVRAPRVYLLGKEGVRVEVQALSPTGFFNASMRWETARAQELEDAKNLSHRAAQAKARVGAEWQHGAMLKQKEDRLAEVDAELSKEERQNAAPAADPDDEGTTTYAIEPDNKDVKRIKKLSERAHKTGEGTVIGSRPNPLASQDEDDKARAFQRGARQRRFDRGDAETVSRDEQMRVGRQMVDEDREGVRGDLLAKIRSGEALNAFETQAAAILRTDAAWTAIRNPGKDGIERYKEAVLFEWAYQEARSEAGRVLGSIRDALGSVRERVASLLAEPSADTRRVLRDPKATAEEKDRALEKEAKRLAKARRWLMEDGIDPDNITDAYLDDPIVAGRIVRIVSTAKSSGWDWFTEWRLASMLGGSATQVANITGNAAMMAYDQNLRRLSETLVNLVVNDRKSPSWGENVAFMRAWLPGFMAASRNFVLAWRTELPVLAVQLTRRGVNMERDTTKIDSLRGPKIPGIVGRIIRAPSLRMLLAADEFFKTLYYWTEGTALAYRKAHREGKTGDALNERMREILNDPKDSTHVESFEGAKRVTFQRTDSKLVDAVLQMRRALDDRFGGVPVGTTLMPFVRTPAEIFRVGLGLPFHPLKALYTIPRGIVRGDKRAVVEDAGNALMSLAITGAVLHMLWSKGDGDDDLPLITGSASPSRGERELENRTVPAYSLRVGDKWYSYRRVEPAAVTLATVVDLGNEFTQLQKQGRKSAAVDVLGRLIGSIADQAADKTFLRTFGDVYQVVVERDSKTAAPRFVRDTLILPMIPNIIRQPVGRSDEFLRQNTLRQYEDRGVWTAMAASLPYYMLPTAERAPPVRYDLWGRPIEKGDAKAAYLLRVLSPTPETREIEDIAKLDLLVRNYNERVDNGELGPDAKPWYGKPPDYWYTRGGVTHYWTNDEWARLQKEAGERAYRNLARRSLNWQQPGERDIERIEDAIGDARKYVRNVLLRDRRQ